MKRKHSRRAEERYRLAFCDATATGAIFKVKKAMHDTYGSNSTSTE